MHDIIVIGAGPGGLTAAVYGLRAGKSVLILEQESIGGQIASSPRVENWPGVRSISGAELADALFEQVMALGADFELERVTEIIPGSPLTVVTEDGRHEALAVIIAAGAKRRHLGLNREDELSGVSYCAVCDGAFYKGKTVAVIGGGSSALQAAIFLSAGCEKVYLIHRRQQFRGEPALVGTLKNRANIEILTECTPKSLLGDRELEGLVIQTPAGEKTLSLDGIFVSVGQMPENEAFSSVVRLSDGYILADEGCVTATPGVFAAGDCRTKQVRQLTTAAADGTVAALTACDYIDRMEI